MEDKEEDMVLARIPMGDKGEDKVQAQIGRWLLLQKRSTMKYIELSFLKKARDQTFFFLLYSPQGCGGNNLGTYFDKTFFSNPVLEMVIETIALECTSDNR